MTEEETYSASQAARILRITPHRVRQMLHAGELEGWQDESGHWRSPARAVHARLEERPPKPTGGATGEDTAARVSELEEENKDLQRQMGRMEGRLELTEKTESSLREERERLLSDLAREREHRAEERKHVEELQAELERARRPWWRKIFGGGA